MKKIFFLFVVLWFILFAANATQISVTNATLSNALTSTVNGDTLLLTGGTYTGNITLQDNKTITLKSDGSGSVIFTGQIVGGATTQNNCGLIVEGITINRNSTYVVDGSAFGNIKLLAFRNDTIRNVTRCFLRGGNTTAPNLETIEFSNCLIRDCGSNGWCFLYPKFYVSNVIVRNSSFLRYYGGESFLNPQVSNTSLVLNFTFENNTFFRWSKLSSYAICCASNKYSTNSNFIFRNNIVAEPGVAGQTPKVLIAIGGNLTAQNNLIVNFGGYAQTSATSSSVTDLTYTAADLYNPAIGFQDTLSTDLHILSSSPLATASTTGGLIGDPRWLKVVSTPRNFTTSVYPAGAGVISPAGGTYNAGEKITVTALRNFGYQFKEWRDATADTVLSTNSQYAFTITKDISLKAIFAPIATYNFTVNTLGSQWGKVTLNPSPTNGKYETGTVVTVTAVPNNVVNFLNWEDQTTGLSRTIQVKKDTTLTATFDEIPFIVGWNFSNQSTTSDRTADYYSEVSNIGLLSLKNADGSSATWSNSSALYSPSYPAVRMWTPAANFSTPRYFQTSFSTVGYKNIRVKSMVGGSYHMYPIVKLQYSVDGVNFTNRKQVDVTPVYNTGWVNLNDTLPAEAEGLTKLYVRWIEDTSSSPLLGNAADVDGTTLTNIYVYADKAVVNDVTAPTLISTVPAEGSTNASANGAIVLTFDEKLKAGTGNCTLGSTALTPSFGSKTVTFAYSKLSYNTDYTFTVPAGALTDIAGNPYAGITIHFRTMNRPQPIAKVFDAIVAKDGSGTYTTIQAAIDAAPSGATTPYLIFVKNGSYNEHIDIPSTKPFIHMIGQYRDSVVITDNRLSGEDGDPSTPTYSVDPGATVVVKSNDCYFENITFSNSYGYLSQAGPQSLALYTNNDKMIFKNCWMRSYQDTYLTGSKMGYRGYLADCKIEGAVDFIYGQGDFFFDKCTIYCTRPTGGYIVAPNHSVGTQWGYVFSNCTIDGNKGVVTYLGRPWHEAPKTSFFNTICKIGIYPAGWWYKMGAIPAIFADYNTMDANGNLLDLSQRIPQYEYDVTNTDGSITTVKGTAKNSFTDAEAAQFTYENVTKGTDGWDPKVKTEKTEAPVVAVSGNAVSWNAVDYAICYVVTLNGKVVNVTTSTSYQPTTNGAIWVQAVSEFGALSTMSNSVQFNNTALAVKTTNRDEIQICQYTGYAVLKNLPENSKLNVFNFSGMLLYSKKCTADNITIPVNQNLVLQVITPDSVKAFKLLNR